MRAPFPFVTVGYLVACALALVWLLVRGASPFAPTAYDLMFAANNGPAVFIDHQPWRLLTGAFFHYGVIHFGVNALFLAKLGPALEKFLGAKRYALLLLLSAIGASVASIAWTPVVNSAGASGALFGVAGAWAVVLIVLKRDFATHANKIDPVVLTSMQKGVPSMIVVNLLIGFFVPFVDNGAHVGGLVTGAIIAAAFLWRGAVSVAAAAAYVVVIVACTVTGFVRVTNSDAIRAYNTLKQSEAAAQAGDLVKATSLVNESVAILPEYVDALRWRASLHIRAQDWASAEKDSQHVLDILPDDVAARRLHILARTQTDTNAAIAEWEQFAKADELLAPAMCIPLARRDRGSDRQAQALAFCDDIVAKRQDAMAYSTRGAAREIVGNVEGYLADANKALELSQTGAELNGVAWAELHNGKLDDALRHADAAIAKGDTRNAWGTRGFIKAARGDIEGAKADMKKAVELDPSAELDRALLLHLEGKKEEADLLWRKLVAEKPWYAALIAPYYPGL